MLNNTPNKVIPTEKIVSRIVFIRGEKVLLDMHLAEIYNVETRALKQAVRRNQDLFPDDFMFVLTEEEIDWMVSQNVIPSNQSLGGSILFAFTEAGVVSQSQIENLLDIKLKRRPAFNTVKRLPADFLS